MCTPTDGRPRSMCLDIEMDVKEGKGIVTCGPCEEQGYNSVSVWVMSIECSHFAAIINERKCHPEVI